MAVGGVATQHKLRGILVTAEGNIVRHKRAIDVS